MIIFNNLLCEFVYNNFFPPKSLGYGDPSLPMKPEQRLTNDFNAHISYCTIWSKINPSCIHTVNKLIAMLLSYSMRVYKRVLSEEGK